MGPLVHLVLSYPTGRLAKTAAAVVAAAYVDGAIAPLARVDVITVVLGVAVVACAAQAYLRTSGPARTARGRALVAAIAYAGILALGALARLSGWDADSTVLWAYDVVICGVALLLFVDLLRGRWRESVVTGLVLDLGVGDEGATLRGKLARALGDPSLVLAYRLPENGGLVDDAGLAVELPATGSGRVVTSIEDRGQQIAVLVHDEAILADPSLVDSVASAARLAVANARLQSEARVQAVELEASRRRIVEAGDAQRRRLELELRLGAERRLISVSTLLAQARSGARPADAASIEVLETQLDEARQELREFAHGVHPAALADGGLMSAIGLLAEHSQLPVEVSGDVGRLPDAVEAALYFVCSEALANAAKHAHATLVRIELRADGNRIAAVISDDGVGGAKASRGSGLRGLADRVEAHGGRLSVESPRGGGTRVGAEIPLR